MKVSQLLEGDLGELAETLLLVKHGKLSMEKAKELAASLRTFTFLVGGEWRKVRLRWAEDKKTGTLKIVSSDVPGSWRSGPAAMSRSFVCSKLQQYGFDVARFARRAAKRVLEVTNGPHIYFWGPGTPEMQQANMKKVQGTDEWFQGITDRVKANSKSRDQNESQ